MELINIVGKQAIVVGLLYAVIFILVGLDLWSGIRKAKQRGEFISSWGLRRTVEKLSNYYNLMFSITATDAIQMIGIYQLSLHWESFLPLFPLFSFMGALTISWIEIVSIWEKAEEKEKKQSTEAIKMMAELLANPNIKDIASNIAEFAERNKTEKQLEE